MIEDGQPLLDANRTKEAIEKLFNLGQEQVFLSAFFTDNAFEWLNGISRGTPLRLAIRATPNDFLSGATDFIAIRHALECNWDIRFISALHAKVYLLGKKIVVGSGNLTGNGMHLMGRGNLELNAIIDVSPQHLSLINSIFGEATPFDDGILAKMENHIIDRCSSVTIEEKWPPEVVPEVGRALFCNDFPLVAYETKQNGDDVWSGISQYLDDRKEKSAADALIRSHAYCWLLAAVESRGGEATFGTLSKILHDSLADDPAPYRRTIKDLLSNLITYIQATPNIKLSIERPRHRQIVKLRC
jgi:hypothetical protein